MTRYPSNRLLWFAVLGGGAAWIVEFFAGVYFAWAQCNQVDGRTNVPVRAWQTGLASAGALVGLASLAVAVWLYLRTHKIGNVAAAERYGDGYPPPLGRVHFLAVCGLTVNFIVLVIIVLVAIAAPLLETCQQA